MPETTTDRDLVTLEEAQRFLETKRLRMARWRADRGMGKQGFPEPRVVGRTAVLYSLVELEQWLEATS